MNRTIRIGLTLPGLTEDPSMNANPVVGIVGATIRRCPEGLDPLRPRRAGSDSTPGTERYPPTRCIGIGALTALDTGHRYQRDTQTVSVGGTTAHVSVQASRAWPELDSGLTAWVDAPYGADLSAGDLAAPVTSIRMSPDDAAADSGPADPPK